MITALAFLAALRSGAQGGPLALEAPDVAYVMLSPVDRMRALLRPVTQRARSAASLGAAFGAIVGQLAGRRLPGTPVAWAASGAAFGISTALLWAGTALVAHAIRLPLWIATSLGLAGVAWQGAALAWHLPGPANSAGSLAMWGWRQHSIDLAVATRRRRSCCSSASACCNRRRSMRSPGAAASSPSCASPSRCRTCAP